MTLTLQFNPYCRMKFIFRWERILNKSKLKSKTHTYFVKTYNAIFIQYQLSNCPEVGNILCVLLTFGNYTNWDDEIPTKVCLVHKAVATCL